MQNFRIGQGFDIHKLIEGKKLILGGVYIPYEKGFEAHSDGDVLIHAIIDSFLGALSLGDIGKFFPDTDEKYKNINSEILLSKTKEIIDNSGWEIVNIDTTIKAQQPKLREHIDKIRKNLSKILKINIEQISIKAKTMEKLGFIGKCFAIEADAITLLKKS